MPLSDVSGTEGTKHDTRESWLLAAVEELKPIFREQGSEVPKVHVSTSWPSSKALGKKCRALGECWSKDASEDGVAQIFISPLMSDPLDPLDPQGVLPTLAHEVVHAVAGHKAGHGPAFRRVAEGIGLEGRMTSTHAGEALLSKLKAIYEKLGPYPHAKLNPALSGKKKQGTRMIKCECSDPECGYTCRTTRKWIELGAPICPVHKSSMLFDSPEEES